MEHGTFAILATLFLTTATPLGTGFQFNPTKRIEHEYILASHIRAGFKTCPPQLHTWPCQEPRACSSP